jgi:hypothetical protein
MIAAARRTKALSLNPTLMVRVLEVFSRVGVWVFMIRIVVRVEGKVGVGLLVAGSSRMKRFGECNGFPSRGKFFFPCLSAEKNETREY